MRPLIGVTTQKKKKKKCGWMWQNYLELIWAAGGMPVVLSLNASDEAREEMLAHCRGILFTGGQDMATKNYPYRDPARCLTSAEIRDEVELPLFHAAYKRAMPIFGICRGMQMINFALGGTLIEDIPTQVKTQTEHRYRPPAAPSMHEVDVFDGTPLMDIVGKTRFTVNSYHHQAVETVASTLRLMARSSTDQIAEAVWAPEGSFLMAVQWHPERIYQERPENLEMLKRFVEAAKAY